MVLLDLNYLVFLLLLVFLINLDFLLPHITLFDNNIVLPLPVFETFGYMFFVFFLHFKQYDDIFLYFRL